MKKTAILAIGLSGCATLSSETSYDSTPRDPAAVHAAIRADLDRLENLDVFTVGGIIRDLPVEATSCYFDDIGPRPCPGWEDEVAAEDAAIEPRLARLVADAEVAVGSADPAYVMSDERVAEDLAALRGLAIVEVGDLIVTTPMTTGNCYGPCPEEQAAVEQNRLRAAKLAAITATVKR